MTTKQTLASFEEITRSMSQITDQLGMGIDPGIFVSVVIFNALGFHTQQSCEGHLDHGKPAPWITFVTPEADIPKRQATRLFAQGEQAEHIQGASNGDALYAEANRLRRQAEMLHAEDKRRLLEYLAAFYAAYRPSYDRLLVVYERTPACSILESQGASTLIGEPRETRASKLREYLEEMRTFTTFLKQRFLDC